MGEGGRPLPPGDRPPQPVDAFDRRTCVASALGFFGRRLLRGVELACCTLGAGEDDLALTVVVRSRAAAERERHRHQWTYDDDGDQNSEQLHPDGIKGHGDHARTTGIHVANIATERAIAAPLSSRVYSSDITFRLTSPSDGFGSYGQGTAASVYESHSSLTIDADPKITFCHNGTFALPLKYR